MQWIVKLCKDVKDFILSLPAKEQAKITWAIDLLEKTGTNLKEPYVKYLKNGIWELRPTKQVRILYLLDKSNFIILHAFKKKTQKISQNEIFITNKRKKEYFKKSR